MFTTIGTVASTNGNLTKALIGEIMDAVTAVVLLTIGSLIVKGIISANPTAPYYLLTFGGFSSSPVLFTLGCFVGEKVKEIVTGQ